MELLETFFYMDISSFVKKHTKTSSQLEQKSKRLLGIFYLEDYRRAEARRINI